MEQRFELLNKIIKENYNSVKLIDDQIKLSK